VRTCGGRLLRSGGKLEMQDYVTRKHTGPLAIHDQGLCSNCRTLATWNDDLNLLELLTIFLDASLLKPFDIETSP